MDENDLNDSCGDDQDLAVILLLIFNGPVGLFYYDKSNVVFLAPICP